MKTKPPFWLFQSPRLHLLVWLMVGLPVLSTAQPPTTFVKVIVAPDHHDWLYKVNDPVRFTISVLKDGNPLDNALVTYQVGPEKMEPFKRDSTALKKGSLTLPAFSLKQPGFLQCVATVRYEGKTYRGLATAGVAPESIKPTVAVPGDFDQFWEKARAESSAVPLDSRMVLIPERSTEKAEVYHISFQNTRAGERIYGILCVPRAPGKYPALLRVPGAGIRPYNGDVANAENGIITLEVGIHGIPVNMDPLVYNSLSAGALNGYWAFNLENKDRYYYKRVYQGCVRANDFIATLPQFDGSNLGVTGGSQGGALSIVTAALDKRVKFLAAFYPALSDLTGYLHGRAGGWPHLFGPAHVAAHNTPDKVATCGYYDVVNFARQVNIPGLYSWGYNDEVCPPTSMYAAYNVITAPKELFLALETGHWTYPEQSRKLNDWIVSRLKNGRGQ